MKTSIFLFIILFAAFNNAALAQEGALDPAFGTNGITTTDFSFDDGVNAIAIQQDGKIIAAGFAWNGYSYDFALARYTVNGVLDNTFGPNGKVTVGIDYSSRANSVAIQSDGKIVVAGYSVTGTNWNFALIRLNSNGTLDSGFNGDGIVTTSISSNDALINSVVIQPGGRIIAAGDTWYPYNATDYHIVLARYDADGSLDSSFDVDGIVETHIGIESHASSVALEIDGKIVAAGYANNGAHRDFALVRYLIDGTLDNSFGADGIITTDINGAQSEATSVAIQPDGKIVAGGVAGSFLKFSLVRYKTDGALDTSFSHDGLVTTVIGSGCGVHSIVIQPDWKIVAAGYANNGAGSDFALARYDTHGIPDSSFNEDGLVTTAIGSPFTVATSMAIEPDGKIIAAGVSDNSEVNWDFALARYLSGLNIGIANFTFSQSSLLIYPNPIQQAGVFQYTLIKDEVLNLNLYDMNGKLMKSFFTNETRTAGELHEELNFGNLASGNYLLSLSNGEQKMSVKIVKQ